MSEADDFGSRVRERRKELGWSQEQLAYRVGLEQTNLSRIERGKTKGSADVRSRIMAALQLASNNHSEQ